MLIDTQIYSGTPGAPTTPSPESDTPFPHATPFLPGRAVTDGVAVGIVTEVLPDGALVVRWDGFLRQSDVDAASVRAVHPDRPAYARDQLLVETLGEELARRAGPDALAGFHDGHNHGRITFRELAREFLQRFDARALDVKHSRCPYTYVAGPDGARRDDPTAFEDGDRLITCTFYPDGTGRVWCGPHGAAGDRGSIYYPTPADMPVPADCLAIEGEPLSPYETPAAVRVEVAA